MKLTKQIEPYKVFPSEGNAPNIEQMPILIREGRYPIPVAELMEERLKASSSSDEEVKRNWLYNYFYTGDGQARRLDGRLKIALDAQPLREINPQTKLINGAVPQSDEQYDGLQGIELSKEEVEKYIGKALSKEDVLNNRAWRILARHPDEVPKELARDKNLLPEYANLVFSEGFDTGMGIYVSSPEDALRLWYVYWLYGGSVAGGDGRLDGSSGRLVGVRSEGAKREKFDVLENRILRDIKEGKAFEFNGKVYAPVQGVSLDQ